jgi:hypothetical protein
MNYLVRIVFDGWSQDEWSWDLGGARWVRDNALKNRGAVSVKIYKLTEVQ